MSDLSSDDEKRCHGDREVEHHDKSTCGYKKHQICLDGRKIYIFMRNCDCSKYKTYASTQEKVDIQAMDGKDVHLSDECRWKKTKKAGGCKLMRKCVCHGPDTAGFVGNSTDTSSTS